MFYNVLQPNQNILIILFYDMLRMSLMLISSEL